MKSQIADWRLSIGSVAILAIMLLASTTQARSQPASTQPKPSTAPANGPHKPNNCPIVFGRAGNKAVVECVPIQKGVKHVVLRAFGRNWTSPVVVDKFVATVEVPSVRVPTVFSVVDPDDVDFILGELVAYPDRDVEWDKKITLYSCGAPQWFDQWAAATGLPVKGVVVADLASAKLSPADEKGKSLLILGRTATGKDLLDVAKVANDKKVNILVLDADWFGDAAGLVNIAPAQMLAGLVEIAKQHWPQPLKFISHRRPWPGIANRWAWIVDEAGLPLVEEIRPLSPDELALLPAGDPPTHEKAPQFEEKPRMLLSYVSWRELLGRSESAEASLLAMISSAATAKPRECHWHPIWFVNHIWPDPKNCDCPILLAVRSGGFWKRQDLPSAKPDYDGPIYLILDLRGQQKGPATEGMSLSEYCRRGITGAPVVNLIILGDDKMLDEWEWLKLDRAEKTINRPGVVWLSDDELPPSKDNQIRLMLKLTELGVPLAPPKQEEKPK